MINYKTKDFSLKIYKELLNILNNTEYEIQTFQDYLSNSGCKTIILRHDVDKEPKNSLEFARVEHNLGIKGSYYFRIQGHRWDEQIIKEIARMGHEIGYHYEDLSSTAKKFPKLKNEEDLVGLAIFSFDKNLASLRSISNVTTICMHGTPLSRWDNRLIWKYFDYHLWDINGEPYLDLNPDEVLYLTDTGRRWNGNKFIVRDKLMNVNKEIPIPKLKNTNALIDAYKTKALPEKIMMTFHPQRWTDNNLLWTKELIFQNVKNYIKYFIITKTQN